MRTPGRKAASRAPKGMRVIRRNTAQRELVREAIRPDQHPSAREIFEAVSKKQPMSFGTVYRNLQILAEAGEIASIQIAPDVMRYDLRLDRHHHLYCKNCGMVFDMPVSYNKKIDTAAAAASGFAVESHSICFTGLCLQCQKKKKRNL
jgi:Fe2+ or Zn2+ uptake regulation protein